MGSPGFDPTTDTTLVLSRKGELVAVAFVMDAVPYVHIGAGCVVHPKHMGRGIGTARAQWIEARPSQAVAKAPQGARVALTQSLDEKEEAAQDLLEQRGYSAVRHFWRMLIEMDGAPPPVLPEGVRLRPFDPEEGRGRRNSGRAGRVPGPLGLRGGPAGGGPGAVPLPHGQRPGLRPDPVLPRRGWRRDRRGLLLQPKTGSDASTGYVQTLGVRRPWRRYGLALALLHHAFGKFHRRGAKQVAPHVDAQSLTGATRLHEKAGMHPYETAHAYEKELRPGVDLTTQTLRE